MSKIEFRTFIDMLTVATPSSGYAIGYDLDGTLKQKDQFGVISPIGATGGVGPQGATGIGITGPSGPIGATGPVSATPSFVQVLRVDNNTGTYSIVMGTSSSIKSSDGGGQIDLDYDGTYSHVYISSDSGALLEGVLEVSNHYSGLAAKNYFMGFESYDLLGERVTNLWSTYTSSVVNIGISRTYYSTYEQYQDISVHENTTSVNVSDYNRHAIFIGTRNSVFSAGITNSVIIGGYSMSATVSNTVYLGNNVNINNAYTLPNTDGASGYVLKTDGSGTVTWQTDTAGSGNGVTASGTVNYVSKFTGTNVLGDSQVFDNGTNVGIGTASPSARLHVVGTDNSTNYALRVESASQSAYFVVRNDGYTIAEVRSNQFRVNGTSPAATNIFETFDSNYGYGLAVEGVYGRVKMGAGYTSSSATLMVGDYGLSNFMNFGENGNFGKIQRSSTGLYFTGFDTADGAQFQLNSDLAYSSTITAWFKRRVGVGLSAPTTQLHVYATQSGTGFRLVDTTEGLNKVLTSDANGVGTWVTASVSSGNGVTASGTINYVSKFTATNVLGDSIIYDSGTNVGIGTASPSYKLSVYLDSTNYANFGGSFPSIYASSNNYLQFNQSNLGITQLTANNYIQLSYAGTSNGLYIDSTNHSVGSILSYNVGDYMFRSYKDVNTNKFVINHFGFGGDNKLGVGVDPTATSHFRGIDNSSSNYSLKIESASASSLFNVRNDGKVSIGTASGTTILHVYGTQSGAFRLQDTTQGAGKVLTSDVNGVGTWATIGSIGIGTTNKSVDTRGFTASIAETITHNLNTNSVIVQNYDSTGLQIIAGSVSITGTGSVSISFSQTLSSVKTVIIG